MDAFERLMLHLGVEQGQQYEELRRLALFRRLRKGEQLSSGDERPWYVSFLLSGVLRGYLLEANGADITDCFLFRYGQAHMGFLEAEDFPTERVEAVTDTELLCFDRMELMALVRNSLELSQLYIRKLTESYAEHWFHKSILHRTPAMDRYRWFLATYPGLIDVVPHKHIASFLDMTPVTLSRLRRSVRQETEQPGRGAEAPAQPSPVPREGE